MNVRPGRPSTTSNRPRTVVWASAAAACAGVTPNAPAKAMAHSASSALNAPGDSTRTGVASPP